VDNKTILLVEDDLDDIALTVRALDRCGVPCKVVLAHDGADAVDYLFATGRFHDHDVRTLPHLILLDLKMPKLDGLQLLQVLRNVRRGPNLPPVVVLTSSDCEKDVTEAYRFGANSYIRKPIDCALFNHTLRQVLQYWLRVNHPPPSAEPIGWTKLNYKPLSTGTTRTEGDDQ
jgi:two-component system response regulator